MARPFAQQETSDKGEEGKGGGGKEEGSGDSEQDAVSQWNVIGASAASPILTVKSPAYRKSIRSHTNLFSAHGNTRAFNMTFDPSPRNLKIVISREVHGLFPCN